MKYSAVLLSQVLLATGILAAPTKQERAERRHTQHIQNNARRAASIATHLPMDVTAATDNSTYADSYSSNWSGSVQTAPPSGTTFTGITGSWNIPTVSEPPSASGDGSWSSAEWVGIDGWTYDSAIFQAGTLSSVTVSGGVASTSVSAWYEWYPNPLVEFTFGVSPGDTVTFTLTATSTTEGVVDVTNDSTGETYSITIDAPSSANALGGQNAEWILEDVSSGGLVAFSDFTEVTFTGCTATDSSGGTVDIDGSTIVDMEQDNTVLATASGSGTTLTVTYG